jgi:hypothetical protein
MSIKVANSWGLSISSPRFSLSAPRALITLSTPNGGKYFLGLCKARSGNPYRDVIITAQFSNAICEMLFMGTTILSDEYLCISHGSAMLCITPPPIPVDA